MVVVVVVVVVEGGGGRGVESRASRCESEFALGVEAPGEIGAHPFQTTAPRSRCRRIH